MGSSLKREGEKESWRGGGSLCRSKGREKSLPSLSCIEENQDRRGITRMLVADRRRKSRRGRMKEDKQTSNRTTYGRKGNKKL